MHDRGAVALPVLLFSAVLAACIVVFLTAGDLTSNQDHGTGTEDTIPHAEWLAAVDHTGRVLVLDERTGAVEARVSQQVDPRAEVGVVLSASHKIAYVASGGEIELVRLESGEESPVARGSHPALSPDDDWLAFTQGSSVVVQNATTGEEDVFRPPRGDNRLGDIVDLAWGSTGRQLLVLTKSRLFSLDHEHAHSLADARPVAEGGSSWTSVAPLGGRVLVATGGTIDSVSDDGTTHVALPVDATGLESDSHHRTLTYVTADGTLWRWDGEGDPQRLASGIIAAAP